MITRTADWKNALAGAIRTPRALAKRLALPPGWAEQAEKAAADFPLRVPQGFADLMRKGDPDDPLLRQVLPLAEETEAVAGFVSDPVGDRAAVRSSGLLQKYRGRALLTVTGACALHCRYCFRRHFPYGEENPSGDDWSAAIRWLAAHSDVTEVILSGGDPLVVDDARLRRLVERMAHETGVRRLRVHTRLPVTLPERVTGELLDWLTGTQLAPVMVVHANHPREISPGVAAALGRLRAAGVTLLNQSVLLRRVNDDATTLAALSERLFESGVIPYYVHLLDRVAGAAHFEVSEERARTLYRTLHGTLPGYLVPRFVRERAGGPGKEPMELAPMEIGPEMRLDGGKGDLNVRNLSE